MPLLSVLIVDVCVVFDVPVAAELGLALHHRCTVLECHHLELRLEGLQEW